MTKFFQSSFAIFETFRRKITNLTVTKRFDLIQKDLIQKDNLQKDSKSSFLVFQKTRK